MAHVVGIDAKMYYDASGVGGSSWSELANVRDVTVSLEKAEIDVSNRAYGGWRANAGALKDATIEWDMIYDTTDAGFTAIRDAWLNDTVIGLAIMDQNITTVGAQGLHADCEIMSFSQPQPMEDAIKVNVRAKPTYSSTDPSWSTTT